VSNSKSKILSLMDQYRCPRGRSGRYVAEHMNQEHELLTLWGLSRAKIESGSIILDVGCGGGKTLSRLAQLAPIGKVFGIDVSLDMVKYSKKVNQKLIVQDRVQVFWESVERMSFPDNYFDLVTAFETYYFWFDFDKALQEIRRVLKPGGKLHLVNEMVRDEVYEVSNAKLIAETHVNLIALQDIRKIMLSIGFVDVTVLTKIESSWNAVVAQK